MRGRVVSEALTGQTPGARVAATPMPVLQSSDTVVDIITALCAAQGKFGVVAKDRTANVEMRGGGSYKYSYATLASVIAAIRPALNEHGIALVQSATSSTPSAACCCRSTHASCTRAGSGSAACCVCRWATRRRRGWGRC